MNAKPEVLVTRTGRLLSEVEPSELRAIEGGVPAGRGIRLPYLLIEAIDALAGCAFRNIPEARHLCD